MASVEGATHLRPRLRVSFFSFFTPTQLLIVSFAFAILLGAAGLTLPSSTGDRRIELIDALFTSTSAVCVTGLTVVDTGSYFTRSGQVMILCLIQLGGLGIITFSVVLIVIAGRRVSIRDKLIMQDSFVPYASGELYRLIKHIFASTLLIEGAGALLLWILTPDRSWFASIFHGISAFCNAGFSLRSDSFVDYRYNIGVNLVTCVLIVMGGLGFFTHVELARRVGGRSTHRFSLHTYLVLLITCALIVGGALSFYLFESRNALRQEGIRGAALISLFQSVTSRTAGFNTVDFATLTNATLFMIILLMFVGASPGSTGGGIKTSTLGVLLAVARSRFRGASAVSAVKRTIPDQTVSKALSVLVLAFTLVTFAVLALAFVEIGSEPYRGSGKHFIEIFFEVVSAFGTVGLSTGITPRLSSLGKFILVLVMFVGRVGPLTMAVAVGRHKPRGNFRYAEENVMVG